MVKITLRLNLSDFLNKSHEEEVISKLEVQLINATVSLKYHVSLKLTLIEMR